MCIKCNELNIILYVTYIQYNIEFVICMTIIETLLYYNNYNSIIESIFRVKCTLNIILL